MVSRSTGKRSKSSPPWILLTPTPHRNGTAALSKEGSGSVVIRVISFVGAVLWWCVESLICRFVQKKMSRRVQPAKTHRAKSKNFEIYHMTLHVTVSNFLNRNISFRKPRC